MTAQQQPETAPWPEVLANVTACEYDARAGRTLAFGLSSSKRFRISYNYWADGELHTGQLYSAVALPQGHLFPLTYNPEGPREHSTPGSTSASRAPLFAIGIAGSVVLSLIWLAILHGCN